jgi:hypothetical protein
MKEQVLLASLPASLSPSVLIVDNAIFLWGSQDWIPSTMRADQKRTGFLQNQFSFSKKYFN